MRGRVAAAFMAAALLPLTAQAKPAAPKGAWRTSGECAITRDYAVSGGMEVELDLDRSVLLSLRGERWTASSADSEEDVPVSLGFSGAGASVPALANFSQNENGVYGAFVDLGDFDEAKAARFLDALAAAGSLELYRGCRALISLDLRDTADVLRATRACGAKAEAEATRKHQAERLAMALAAYENRRFPRALDLFNELAGGGHAEAQRYLGDMHHFGHGTSKNDAEAVKWWRRAAEAGDVGGQFSLARALEKGEGVPVHLAGALHWYRKAASQGDLAAMSNLGRMYGLGLGMPEPDPLQGFAWLSRAADRGHAKAAETIKQLPQVLTPEQIAEVKRRAAQPF